MRTKTFSESYRALTRLVPYLDTWGWYACLMVFLVLLPLVAPAYIANYGTLIFIAATGAVGLNLVT